MYSPKFYFHMTEYTLRQCSSMHFENIFMILTTRYRYCPVRWSEILIERNWYQFSHTIRTDQLIFRNSSQRRIPQ
jgi:hypothetical protein